MCMLLITGQLLGLSMRRNAFLVFSLLTLMATLLATPAFAASKVEYRANGKVTTYDGNQYPPSDPSSVVVGGASW